ncbi:YjfB family protein [Thiomicrorhabdus sp.]|uniref:YjfB family protein n=1 Tax=Thiomicrorhabdus sp. TaxID=2039724 RepID=UPI0029C69CE6|nr:YjfB family protein [Thiomicrorhabdus sp.]
MDISGVSAAGAVSAVLAQQQVYTQEQAGVSILKKSLDMQSQNALTLIQSIPQASSTQGLPPNLSNNINTTA